MINKKQIYGYCRVSTKEQNEDRQLIALYSFGVLSQNVFLDKVSGKDFNRPAYRRLVDEVLCADDLLVIKSIDRLGRNYDEILSEWRYITKEKRADIKVLDMPLLDTAIHKDLLGTLISDIVLQLLSFVAHSERDLIHQRQAEGIAAAKARGVKFGRPKSGFPKGFEEIYLKWRKKELSPRQSFKAIGLTPNQFYKLVERYERNR